VVPIEGSQPVRRNQRVGQFFSKAYRKDTFNPGSVPAFAQTLAPGVYVAMNGPYFAWDTVRKNRQTGMFEAR
jgi:hypothetical protein